MKENIVEEKSNVIKVLNFPEAIRTRPGMYIGDVADPTQLLIELIGNIQDEVSECSYCNKAVIDQNWNGYHLIMDNGRGISINMMKSSPEKPFQTSVEVALTNIHAGSKFGNTDVARIGMNGVGLKCCNACSEEFIVMSRITEDNYNKSIPDVEKLWNSCGPRSKKDLFYIIAFRKGVKVYESAGKLDNIEKMIFGSKGNSYDELPRGFSTIILYKADPEIFESLETKIPIKNLQYFLLLQEKLYKKKVEIMVNKVLINGTFKPFQFEFLKTITPSDTSKNKSVTVYVTFEADPELGQKKELGSVAGLSVEQGVHINYIETCFEDALRNEYKIKHKYTLEGLKICVIVIAADVVFSSQTKERLKSISKVKQSDFNDITKEFQKIFRNNSEYWEAHVGRLNYLAESMKSLTAAEKAQKMIDEAQGRSMFKTKAELIPGFNDATELKNRWDCECFLCFTGETEILTCNNEKISFIDLVNRMNKGETFYTFSCIKEGIIKPAKIIAAKKIKQSTQITTVTLDNGESFRCTPDHKIMLRSGEYKEAKDLVPEESLMSFSVCKVDCGNHKVISVKTEDCIEDVYCLEVDTPEHNFPLAAGIFVKNCEGLSSSGSLTSGRRSTQYHAILPLRGKILNVEGKSMDQAMDNKEIFTIFKVIGLGIGENNVTNGCKTPEEAYEKIKKYSRFGKIIIATD